MKTSIIVILLILFVHITEFSNAQNQVPVVTSKPVTMLKIYDPYSYLITVDDDDPNLIS